MPKFFAVLRTEKIDDSEDNYSAVVFPSVFVRRSEAVHAIREDAHREVLELREMLGDDGYTEELVQDGDIFTMDVAGHASYSWTISPVEAD